VAEVVYKGGLRVKKFLAWVLAITFALCLTSCGKGAVIDGYTGEDGTVEFSVSDFVTEDGSVELPFFPADITEENFKDYMGMTPDEFNDKYSFDGETAGMPALMDGIPCTLGVKLNASRGTMLVIGFGTATDVSRDELVAFTEKISSWLGENTEGSGLTYTSPDGKTEISRVVQQLPGSSDDDLMVWQLTLTYLN
jgi:hypothetical protein